MGGIFSVNLHLHHLLRLTLKRKSVGRRLWMRKRSESVSQLHLDVNLEAVEVCKSIDVYGTFIRYSWATRGRPFGQHARRCAKSKDWLMSDERKWVRNPKHRKYLPGEEEADDVRNERRSQQRNRRQQAKKNSSLKKAMAKKYGKPKKA